MNNLSWFIYLTQIADNVGTTATIILIVGMMIGVIAIPVSAAMREELEIPAGALRKGLKSFAFVMSVALLIAVFTPDRRTMLLIAGSEIGQRAANSQSAQDIINPGMDLLKTWIKRETEKLTKEKS